jgi:hypothetical protein
MTVEIQVRCRGRADIAEFQSAGTKFAAIIVQNIISGFRPEYPHCSDAGGSHEFDVCVDRDPAILRASASGYPLG